MSKYLITGVAGFIGSNLCETLLNQGHSVVGLDNLVNGKIENIEFAFSNDFKSNFTFLEKDIRHLDTYIDDFNGVDYVLHQAALGSVPRSILEPELYHENNITGTLNVLQAASKAKVKRLVFASSSSVYGDTPVLPKVESMSPSPKSPYALSKITGEYYCKLFTQLYGLDSVCLRYFNVFGKRQSPESEYAAVIPKFISSYLNNEAPIIYGDGEQTRDFTYIQNVVNANLEACISEKAIGHSINVGCGERISVNRLAHTIKEKLNASHSPSYKAARSGDVKDSLADITRLQEHLNVRTLISLEDGLKETVNWYKGQ